MRYLNLALMLVVAGSGSAFACGGSSGSVSAGPGGSSGEAGEGNGGGGVGNGGKGGSAGKGGTAAGGTAGSDGTAGNGGTAGSGVAGDAGAGPGGDAGAVGMAGEGGAGSQAPALEVTISGLPDGSVANVTITGPSSFTQNISATTDLNGLAFGSYSVAAPSVHVVGAQVDAIYDATITDNPADVEPGTSSVIAVNYARRGGTSMVWVTNAVTHNAFGFSADALAGTGAQTAAPDVVLNLADVGTNSPPTEALAFSSTNDAWVGTCKNSQKPQVLAKFKPAKLAASGTPAADVQITLPGADNTYDCASALAFDAGGNLWVGMFRGHILRYNASDLTTSGTPAPAVTLTNATVFNGIVDMAFNGDSLIVGAYNQPKVSILSAAQLAASNAALVPAVSVTLPAGAGIGGLALGAGGSLWVADYNHSSLLQFSASALTTSGTPVPSVTLTGVPGPEQLAFDKLGNLWVASYDASKVYAFAAADTAASGAPTPLTTFTGDGLLNSTYGLRFSPMP